MNDYIKEQPAPLDDDGDLWMDVIRDIVALVDMGGIEEAASKHVLEDMFARRNYGIGLYGKPLSINNGRSFLIDLYQETLDATVYLRGLIALEKENETAVRDMYWNMISIVLSVRKILEKNK